MRCCTTLPSTSLPLWVTKTACPATSLVLQGKLVMKPGPYISLSRHSAICNCKYHTGTRPLTRLTELLASILTENILLVSIGLVLMEVTRPCLHSPSSQQTLTRDPVIIIFLFPFHKTRNIFTYDGPLWNSLISRHFQFNGFCSIVKFLQRRALISVSSAGDEDNERRVFTPRSRV